jgi:hypothetical protein
MMTVFLNLAATFLYLLIFKNGMPAACHIKIPETKQRIFAYEPDARIKWHAFSYLWVQMSRAAIADKK